MERIGTFCDKCRMPSCICEKQKDINNKFNKDAIIMWMARRIKDEQRKHSSHNENWHEIAARKLYATYQITLKPVIETDNECDYCGNLYCQGSCGQYH